MSSQATLSQVDAASSLLSLSIAAAGAPPIPIPDRSQSAGSGATPGVHGASFNGSQGVQGSPASTGLGNGARHHRRLSSTGKARRRLSDARDAANRPSPALLQSSAPALSLASLSLSTSLPAKSQPLVPTSVTSANGIPSAQAGQPSSLPLSDGDNIPSSAASAPAEPKVSESTPVSIGPGKSGRKRGVDHRCESCSKVYRHPSCLIKHRWEHTTHWREASKFVLSKHQQVQLLEAAAILSHLHPSAQSLPEDRSLWPSFLSGGSLPKVEPASPPTNGTTTHPVSSSVPAAGNFYRSTSSGPRLHDYSIPASSTGSGGITQLRPGVLGVPAGSGTMGDSTASKPVPVPTNVNSTSDSFRGYRGATADSWTSSPFDNGHTPSSFLSTGLSSGSAPFPHSDERSVSTGAGGWSLPRSSVRSVSASSQSRSRSGSASGSRSDEESVDVDLDGYVDECSTSRYAGRYDRHGRGSRTWKREEDEMSIGFSVREEDEGDDEGAIGGGGVRAGVRKEPEWDGLEMDMDMD